MSNFEVKALRLSKKNTDEIIRAGTDVLKTPEGTELMGTIRARRFDYLAEQRVMLEIRKNYLVSMNMNTREKSSPNLSEVCDKAIKAEERKPLRVLKRILTF